MAGSPCDGDKTRQKQGGSVIKSEPGGKAEHRRPQKLQSCPLSPHRGRLLLLPITAQACPVPPALWVNVVRTPGHRIPALWQRPPPGTLPQITEGAQTVLRCTPDMLIPRPPMSLGGLVTSTWFDLGCVAGVLARRHQHLMSW